MTVKKTALDLLYESCRRFDEGEMNQTPEYRALLRRLLELENRARQNAEDETFSFDEYLECTACDTECERRHYFAEGFRMGYEAGQGEIHSGLEQMKCSGT